MTPSDSNQDHELRQEARKRAAAKLSFLGHLAIYLITNTVLVAVDLLTSPGDVWFYWSLLGWGVGVAAHGVGVYGSGLVPRLMRNMEEREMQKLRKEQTPRNIA